MSSESKAVARKALTKHAKILRSLINCYKTMQPPQPAVPDVSRADSDAAHKGDCGTPLAVFGCKQQAGTGQSEARGSSEGTGSRAQQYLFNFLEHTVGHAQVTSSTCTDSTDKSSGDQVTMVQENGLNKMMATIHLVQQLRLLVKDTAARTC